MENENKSDNRLQLNIQRDMREITKLIEGYVKTTYVKEIQDELFNCRKRCTKHPSKEVELFNALMPYIPSDRRNTFEGILTLLEYEQVLMELVPKNSNGYTRAATRSEQDNIKIILLKVFLYNMLSNQGRRQ